jgi:hypothetical protein
LKIPITRGWVNSFVRRHSSQIFKTKGALKNSSVYK